MSKTYDTQASSENKAAKDMGNSLFRRNLSLLCLLSKAGSAR